jgi:hypothetical protein
MELGLKELKQLEKLKSTSRSNLHPYLPVFYCFIICRQKGESTVGCLAPLDLVYLFLYFQTFEVVKLQESNKNKNPDINSIYH